jgi:excisionase family DNA binding protein
MDATCYIGFHTLNWSGLVTKLPEQLIMQEQERWLSVEEIAAHLGVNRDTIYKWLDRRQMPAHKLGKLWKFKASEIDEWIRAGKAAEGAEKE